MFPQGKGIAQFQTQGVWSCGCHPITNIWEEADTRRNMLMKPAGMFYFNDLFALGGMDVLNKVLLVRIMGSMSVNL